MVIKAIKIIARGTVEEKDNFEIIVLPHMILKMKIYRTLHMILTMKIYHSDERRSLTNGGRTVLLWREKQTPISD